MIMNFITLHQSMELMENALIAFVGFVLVYSVLSFIDMNTEITQCLTVHANYLCVCGV